MIPKKPCRKTQRGWPPCRDGCIGHRNRRNASNCECKTNYVAHHRRGFEKRPSPCGLRNLRTRRGDRRATGTLSCGDASSGPGVPFRGDAPGCFRPLRRRPEAFECIGTRAQGMGGAFVGVADDASAVYWNPAGLAGGAYFSLASSTGTPAGRCPTPSPGRKTGLAGSWR